LLKDLQLVYLFVGRAISGLAIGALTHVVPMYLAEISSANIRGSLVSLQQLAIALGVGETTSNTEVIHLTPHDVDPC
jgi:MFS family permease